MASLFITIAQEIEHAIPRMLSSGSVKLPSEADLCKQYKCSRQTIRAALSFLQNKGLIIKYKGSGSYISLNASRRRVVLLIPSSNEYVFPSMVRYAREFFSDINLEFECQITENNVFTERQILLSLCDNPPAGIIFMLSGNSVSLINEDLYEKLNSLDVPMVCLNSLQALPEYICTAGMDIEEGTKLAVSSLLSTANTFFKAVLPIDSPSSPEKYLGIFKACISKNIQISSSDILWLSFEDYNNIRNGNYENIRLFIHNNVSINTSVFCGNDEIAYHIVRQIEKLGYSIPDEVSVCGFDNSYYCTLSSPTITSVGTQSDALIKSACRCLLLKMTSQPCESVKIPMSVFKRSSTI